MVDAALRRRIATLTQIEAVIERLPSAPGRSRRKLLVVLSQRDGATARRESPLEDCVFEALQRFGLPLPEPQYPVAIDGRLRRIDLCYAERWLALEAMGFDPHRHRDKFDGDALRGNELQLAGFRVLEFTSAFSDWKIASQVAAALGLSQPARPSRPMTFVTWLRRRDRLARTRR